MPELTLTADEGAMPIANLLQKAGLVQSTSEAMRMIQQGAVRIDGERVEDKKHEISVGAVHVYQVGKRRFCPCECGLRHAHLRELLLTC